MMIFFFLFFLFIKFKKQIFLTLKQITYKVYHSEKSNSSAFSALIRFFHIKQNSPPHFLAKILNFFQKKYIMFILCSQY